MVEQSFLLLGFGWLLELTCGMLFIINYYDDLICC